MRVIEEIPESAKIKWKFVSNNNAGMRLSIQSNESPNPRDDARIKLKSFPCPL